ncbi:hypothetical protein ACFQRL_15165 [Microbacterium fluvii]|uniref:Oligosaccharide repeat unit polymerase n=1 Tax=Microbacterium fluvii TaxID=415215 RepID=A0ABW2HJW0_9MICO|nr:hypothetical protein [Microbacterium fluvii]MCU4673934.1 hypothetical protein [Microbacterium fluvii]
MSQQIVATERREGTILISLGFATFGALGIVVPTIVLLNPDSGRSSAWMLTFAILIVASVRLSWLIARGRRRLFEFVFWLFCYVFFGLAPTVQLRADALSTTTAGLDPELDAPTAATAAVGIVGFAVGFWLARRAHGRTTSARFELAVSRRRLIVLTVVAVACSTYYVSRLGVGVLFSSRAEFSLVENLLWPDPTTNAMIAAISSFPILIAAHGWWSTAHTDSSRGAARVGAVMTAIAMLVTNPISSARYHFGVVWGSFLGPLGAYRTRLRTSLTMVGIVFGLLFVFPIADLFRRLDSVNADRSGFLGEYEGNGDYDAFGQLSNAILYDATMPFRFARQFLGILFFWLPRSIWSDKPTGSGVLLAEFREYSFTNLSAPIWAELLLSFGFIGVVIGSVLLAYLLGRLDSRFMTPEPSPIAAIAGAVFPFYLLILLRGSLLQATGILVVLILSLLFISQPRPAPGAAPPTP